MENKKVLSAISYLSIFIFGFITPLIIFFVSKDEFVKKHAKKAMWSHFFLVILYVVLMILMFVILSEVVLLITMGVFILIALIVTIWNIVQAIKILRD